jgi:fibronectin-binding autotransporter adhesin
MEVRVMNRSKTRPFVEQLEGRWVPATITLYHGSLTISGPILGAIGVTQNALTGAFNVTEGGRNQGTYVVTGNLTIDTTYSLMPRAADFITVTLANGKRLNGNLTINSGNGNDTVGVDGAGGEGTPARIGGNLNIDAGKGNDTVSIGTANGLRVGGLTQLNGNLGANTMFIGNGTAGATTLSGDTKITNVQNLPTNGATFAGNLCINDANTTNPNSVWLDFATSVGKSLRIIGGSGSNVVTLEGTVSGTTTVDLSNGHNFLTVNATAFFAQDFTYTGGSRGDTVNLGAAGFGGDLNLTEGDGKNAWNLASNFTVGGDMNLTAGNGDNAFGAFEGQVDGNLTITVGYGTNSFNFSGAAFARVDGVVTYTSGNGDNTFEVSTGFRMLTLNITFGTGDDTFTIDSAADQANLTGFLNWGDNLFGNDTFNEPAGGSFVLPWQFLGVQ